MKQELENLTTIIKKTTIPELIASSKYEYDELDKKMKNLGFSFIGSGLDKRCYVSYNNDYVIKFQVGENDQVKNEIKIYKELPEEAKPFYLESLAYDTKNFKWVIVRKAKVCDDGSLSYAAANRIMMNLTAELESLDVYIGLDDLGDRNVGEIDGKPVIIDYGF